MAGKVYSVGIYARLSVEGSSRKNESVQTQIEIAKEYMKGREDMVLYDCYSDLGKTGTDFEREGFERLMADVKLRRVDCVIVKDFSRFGRNYIEAGNYIQKIFPFLGVRFVSVTDCFDSLVAENDDLGVNLKNLANEMYARDIALKVKSSKRTRRESGSYVGGVPPYGYRAEWICGKKCLLVESETAGVVKWIYDQYEEGRSLREIAAELYAREIHRPTEYHRYNHPCRQPGEALHEWPRTSIKALLTNIVYTGCMEIGGTGVGNDVLRKLKGDESGGSKPEGTESAYEPVKENTHEAIVSGEQFCRIAGRFEERAEKAKGRASCAKREEKDLFDGVLFCGCCGKKLGRRDFVKKSETGGKIRSCSYFCRNSGRIDDFCCETGTVSRDVLTEMVNAVLRQEAALNGILTEELEQENIKGAGERKAEIQKEINAIQKRLKAAERAGSEQYRKYREGIINRETFLEWRAQDAKEAEKERLRLEEERRRIDEVDTEAERQRVLLRELTAFPEKSELDGEWIPTLIQRIDLYPDKRAEITFRFASRGLGTVP